MATTVASGPNMFGGLPAVLLSIASAWSGALAAEDVQVPEVPVIGVSPQSRDSDSVLSEWGDPHRPAPLSSRERQAALQQISGGGSGGLPLLNNIQNQGRTPTLRQVVLTVKRPWYVHRAFLAGEGVHRLDPRSVMLIEGSSGGRAIVGVNLIEGTTYLVDFLLRGDGSGDYSIETSAGVQPYPDPDGKRTHILLALEAEASGWSEVSLRREGGAFELHSVEVTLARGPNEAEN